MTMPYKNKIIGIYRIINVINGKFYIGSALSIKNRFNAHRNLLNNNKHFNSYLQNAWNKYGESNFRFEIIEETIKKVLQIKEEYYIKLYKSNNREFGYNSRVTCNTNLGVKASEKTKEKLRLSHLGHKRTKETQEKISNSQYKPVYQLDLNLNIIGEYKSIKEASEINKFCSRSISLCARKKMNSHPRGKYHWCFEKDYLEFKKPVYKKWKKKKF